MCWSVISCVLPGMCLSEVSGAGGALPAGRWTGVLGTPYAHAGESGGACGVCASAIVRQLSPERMRTLCMRRLSYLRREARLLGVRPPHRTTGSDLDF